MPNQFLTEPQILSNSAAVSGNFTVGSVLSASRICSLNYTGNVVRSVAGKTGDVVLALCDVPGAPTPGNSTPSSLGISSPGGLTTYARADHVHPASLTSSPSLEDNSRNIASTEFVKSQAHTGSMSNSVSGGNSGVSSYGSAGAYRFALGTHAHPPDPTKIDVAGGTFTGNITGTQAYFSYVSATRVQGDGSLLTNVSGTDVTKMPLAGGTFTGNVTGSQAYFSYVSAARVQGEGSLLTNVFGTDVTKMPLAGGTFTGNVTGSGAYFNSLSADVLYGDGSQLRNVLGLAAIAQFATYDVSNCASAAQQIGHALGAKNNESLVVGYYSNSVGACSVTLGNSAIGNLKAVTVGIAACAGLDSVSVGYNAKSAISAIAIGQVTNARSCSVVIGAAAGAGLDSVSIGLTTQSSNCGISIGNYARSGGCGVAIGNFADGNTGGTAVGFGADASGLGTSIGIRSCAENSGVAVGNSSCGVNNAVAVGNNAKSNLAGVAVGRDSFAAQCGTAIGHQSCAIDCNSTAMGFCSIACLADTVVGTCAVGSVSSVAVGENTIANHAAVAVGYQAQAATHAIAIGALTTALCEGSVVIGDEICATAPNQVLIGCAVKSSDCNSTIIGYRACGIAPGGTSIGTCTVAGLESATLGTESKSEKFSVAAGSGACACDYSVSIGYKSKATTCSIAIGSNSCSSDCSLAMGISICAETNSMSIGQNVNSKGSSTAIGKNSSANDSGTAFAEGSFAQKCSSAYGLCSKACTGSTSIGRGAWSRCFGTVIGSNSGATTWGSISIGPDAKIRGFCVADVNAEAREGFTIPRIPQCYSQPIYNNRATSVALDYCDFIHHATVAKTVANSEVICDVGLGYNINPALYAPNTNVCGCGIPPGTVLVDVYRDDPSLGPIVAGQNNVNKAFHCDGRYRFVLSKVATSSIDNTLLKFTHPYICYNDAAIASGSNILSICSTSQEPLVGTYCKSDTLPIGAFACFTCDINKLASGFEGGLIDGYSPFVGGSSCASIVPTFPRSPRRMITDNAGFAYIFEDDGSANLGAIRKVNLANGVTTTIVSQSVNRTVSNIIGPIISRAQSNRYSTTTDGTYVYVADVIDHVLFKFEIATGARTGLTKNSNTGVNPGLSGVSGFVGEIGFPYIFTGLTSLVSAQYYAPSHLHYITDNAATAKRYLTFANTSRSPLIATSHSAGNPGQNLLTSTASNAGAKLPLDGDFGPGYGFIIWEAEIDATGVGLSITPRASLSKVSRRGDDTFLANKTITEIVKLTRDPVGNIFVAVRASSSPSLTYDVKNLVEGSNSLSDLIIKIPAGTNAFLPANTFGLAKSSYAVSNNTALHATAYPNLRYPQMMTISPRTGELIIVDSNIHGDNQMGTDSTTGTIRNGAAVSSITNATASIYKVTQHGYKRPVSVLRPATLPAGTLAGSLTAILALNSGLNDHRYGLAATVDNDDNIYISCLANNTIHMLSAVSLDSYGNHSYVQVFPTYAGKGNYGNINWPGANYTSVVSSQDAPFFSPRGLAVDRNKVLYVADTGNSCIKRVEPPVPGASPHNTTRGVTYLTGSAAGTIAERFGFADSTTPSLVKFKSPYSLALTNDNRYLYVTDTLNCRVRRVDTVTGATITIVGTGVSSRIDNNSSTFNVALSGNNFFDSNGNPVNGAPALMGPRGIAIKEFPLEGGFRRTFIYITDTSIPESSVLPEKLPLSTGSTAGSRTAPLLTNQGSAQTYIRRIELIENSNNRSSSNWFATVNVITLVGGTPSSTSSYFGYYYQANPRMRRAAQRIGLYDANGLTIDTNGNLYVSETANSTVRKITPEGLVLDYLGYDMATQNRAASAVTIVDSLTYPTNYATFNNTKHPHNGDWFETFSGRITGIPLATPTKLQDIINGSASNVFYHNITELTWGTQNNAGSNQLYVLTSAPQLSGEAINFTNANNYTTWGSSLTLWGWATPEVASSTDIPSNQSGRAKNCIRMLNTGMYMHPHDGFCRTIVGSVNYGKLLDSRYGLYGSLVNCVGMVGFYKNAAFDGAGLNGLFLLDVSKDGQVGVIRRINQPVSATQVYSLSTVYGNPYAIAGSTPINTSVPNLAPVAIIDNLGPKFGISAPKYPIQDFAVVNTGNTNTQIYFSDTKNDVIRRYHIRSQYIETYAGVAGVPDEDYVYYPYINPVTLKYARTGAASQKTADVHLHGIAGSAGVNTPFDLPDQGGVRPFAGGLIPFFNRPRGLVLNAAQDTLYVADSQNHAVRRINLSDSKGVPVNTVSPFLAGSLSAVPPVLLASLANDTARAGYLDFTAYSPSPSNRIPTALDLNYLRGLEYRHLINSLRFRSGGPSYLSRTFTSVGNRKTWTWSASVRRSNLSTTNPQVLFAPTRTEATDFSEGYIYFAPDNTLVVSGRGTQLAANIFAKTTATFTDTTTWYHIVVAFDSTQSIPTNRLRIYVNGSLVTSYSTYNPLSLNSDYGWNTATTHEIGRGTSTSPTWAFDGYLADVYFIDGFIPALSSLGRYDYTTDAVLQTYRIWSPMPYTGSYGINGFNLKFEDIVSSSSTSVGKDFSSNNNNFTPNNIVLTNLSSAVTEISGWAAKNGLGAFANATLPAASDNTNAYRFLIAKATTTVGANAVTYHLTRPLVATSKIEAYCYISGAVISGQTPGKIRANAGLYTDVPVAPTGTTVNFAKVNLNTTTLNSITVYHTDTVTAAGRDFWLSCFLVDDVPVFASPNVMALYAGVLDLPTNYASLPLNRGIFATLNPANGDASTSVLSNGNLTITSSSTTTTNRYGTIPITLGRGVRSWYWEVTVESIGGGASVGITTDTTITGGAITSQSIYHWDGKKYPPSAGTAYGSPWTSGDVISVLLSDNGTLTFFRNGVSQGAAFTGLTGVISPVVRLASSSTLGVANLHINFGQRPFAYSTLAASNNVQAINSYNFPTNWEYVRSAVETRLFSDFPTPVTVGLNPVGFTGFGLMDSLVGSGSANHGSGIYGSLNKPTRLTLNTNTSASTIWGAINPEDILYVADTSNDRIRKIFNPKGAIGVPRLSTVALQGTSTPNLTAFNDFFLKNADNNRPIVDVTSDNTGRIYYARKENADRYFVTRLNASETTSEVIFTSAAEVYAIQSDPVGARVFVSGSYSKDSRVDTSGVDETLYVPNVWSVNTGDKTFFDLYNPPTKTKYTPTGLAYDMELEKATVNRNVALLTYDFLESKSAIRNNLIYARLKVEPGYKMKIGMLVEGFVFGNNTNLFAPNTYVTSILDTTRVALSKPFPGTTTYTSTGTSRLTARFQQTDYRMALPIQLTENSDIMTVPYIGLSSMASTISALRVGDYLADILIPQYYKMGKDANGVDIPVEDITTVPVTYEGLDWPGSDIISYFGEFPQEAKDEGDGKVHPVVITQVLSLSSYRLSRIAIKSSPGFVTGYFTPGAGISVGLNATTTWNTSFALGSNSNPLSLEPGSAPPAAAANYLRVTVNGRDYMMPLYNIPN